MGARERLLNLRVAEAADAWLTDPRDTGVYARLVAAVEERRAYLNPPLDTDPAVGRRRSRVAKPALPDPHDAEPVTGPPADAVIEDAPEDQAREAGGAYEHSEGGSEDPASLAAVAAVGNMLGGTPQEALERLRRG